MRTLILIAVGIVTLSWQSMAQNAETLFGQGQHQEEVEGNLEQAIQTYRQVLSLAGPDRALAARAQFRIGASYEKLGRQEATNAYQIVVRDFADQADIVAEAQSRLAAIGDGASGGKILARQLPSVPGEWYGARPVPSADGKRLYVVDGDYCDAGIIDLETGERRWLGWGQAPCAVVTGPVVPSPDGRLLAYDWHGYTENGRVSEIRIADADGRNPRTVFEGESPGVVAWTPDQQGLFVRRAGLSLLDLESGTFRSIAEAGQRRREFIPSPDGRWVAYGVQIGPSQDNGDVYVVSSEGGERALILGGPANESPLAWTTDGTGLLISSNRGGDQAIWGIAIEEGKPRGEPKLIHASLPAEEPLGMTRSGTLLLVENTAQTTIFEVVIDEVTGRAQTPVPIDVNRTRAAPRYLPDGERAVYVFDDNLAVRNLETGQEDMVDARCGSVGGLYGVHANGKLVLALCARFEGGERQARYYFIDVETGEAQLLLNIDIRHPAGPPSSPVLSGDGSRLYFKRRGVFKSLEIATMEERGEWEGRGFNLYGFSPDDRQMAILGEDLELVVQIESTVTGGVRELARGYADTYVTWSGNGEWVYFIVREDGKETVKRMPAEGGASETVYVGNDIPWQGLSVHPSGNRFFVGDITSGIEVWALDNIGNVSLE